MRSAFHQVCVDRWLIQSQAYLRRECPLCKADPLAQDEENKAAAPALPWPEETAAQGA